MHFQHPILKNYNLFIFDFLIFCFFLLIYIKGRKTANI